MRYAIFSDIHSNLEAFEAVLEAYGQEAVDAYVCIGDVVGYGADPQACLERLWELKAACVAGNHDRAVTGQLDPHYFNRVALEAVAWTQKQLGPKYLDYLRGLDLVYRNDDFIMVHGTLPTPQEFIYLVKLSQAKETFAAMDRGVCFVGHTHVPMIVVQKEGDIRMVNSSKIQLEPKAKYIINPGGVGQPRDGNPQAAYCVYDTVERSIEIHRVAYDIEKAQEKIRQAGLPDFLASRLAMGQ